MGGVDFPIYEPTPFSPEWCSHKFKGAGLRCEIGVSISSGDIVWVHGPFPCWPHSDLKFLRLGLRYALDVGERVSADDGHRGEECFKDPDEIIAPMLKGRIRARHESPNRRIKQLHALGRTFRHCLSRHSISFHAAADLAQLMIENEDPLFNSRPIIFIART